MIGTLAVVGWVGNISSPMRVDGTMAGDKVDREVRGFWIVVDL